MYAPPRFEGTKGSSYGILARKILEAQANINSIITTNNKHGKREFETHIETFINRKGLCQPHNHCLQNP